MKHYPIMRNWPKIRPHLKDEQLNRILIRDFNKFLHNATKRRFKRGMVPRDFNACDWDRNHKGKIPAFWQYVCFGSCHWMVNFNLRLISLAEPNKQWRIIKGMKHSTVWDGKDTIFDLNYSAFGISADETFKLANKGAEYLKVNEFFNVGYGIRKK